MFQDLKDKNIHIVGISGTEGSSLALFFINQNFKNLTGHDFSTKANFRKNYINYHKEVSLKKIKSDLKKLNGIKINYNKNYLKDLNEADFILVPSSWFRYKCNNKLKKYSKKKYFWNWYNLLLHYYQGTFIGITGTAGKGTTTNLIFKILKKSKKNVIQVGESWQEIDFNKIFKADSKSYLVAELSNRTLTFASKVKRSPDLAVITNITKNHLDDHQGSFNKYYKTKLDISKYQTKDNILFLNNKLKGIKTKAKKIYFSFNNVVVKNKNLIGEHLLSDVAAAELVAKALKISKQNINKGLNSFKARSGRLEYIGSKNGVNLINDAASTRPEATIFAVKSFPKGKVNLILEGSRYKLDVKQYLLLIDTVKRYKVRNVALSGQITRLLYSMLKKESINVVKTKSLLDSIKQLYKLSEKGDYLLLSPSAESFGEFKDYRGRIELFNKYFKK
ncbi:hypothetical protein HOE31_00880 [bacterium]|jgi:UDP-N-acetylmuramoylalanine--D-glutamate ligase|nr:hypothetical protein [bacterium]MBT4121489.1 hypothetical protein [bacterium]MBT4335085.1 hypothetical protein [bacterium]MBT4495374.1 hypothetical protein [bacterium]MBT4764101.1 hypothetical protein [bacterium]